VSEGEVREVIIIGGGPAGYTAALYAARANLNPLVIEGFAWGGQLMITSDVENYPGYPDGVLGPEMMNDFRRQAERFGAEYLTDDVTEVDFTEAPFRVSTSDEDFHAKAVIVATGANARQIGLESERTLQGRGVSYCAVCDAAFFREKEVVVVGDRRGEFRASPIMLDRARANPKIRFLTPYVVEEALGEDNKLSAVRVSNVETGEEQELPAHGLFVAIGHDPNTKLFVDQLDMDEAGYLVTKPGSTATNVEGVFAAGDVVDHTYRQAITAAGSGSMAALDTERWLSEREGHPDTALTAPRPEAAEV
jgi:thioredoxin reductase (NADPH)